MVRTCLERQESAQILVNSASNPSSTVRFCWAREKLIICKGIRPNAGSFLAKSATVVFEIRSIVFVPTIDRLIFFSFLFQIFGQSNGSATSTVSFYFLLFQLKLCASVQFSSNGDTALTCSLSVSAGLE